VYFLIYDYARGGDLSRMMIKLRIMEESMARVMFTKIFIALKLCHAKGIRGMKYKIPAACYHICLYLLDFYSKIKILFVLHYLVFLATFTL